MNASGSPLTSSVMSGRNSSSPFLQGNSVTTCSALFPNSSKSINLTPDAAIIRLKNASPKSSLSSSRMMVSSVRAMSSSAMPGLRRRRLAAKMSVKMLARSSRAACSSGRYAYPNRHKCKIAGILTRLFSVKFMLMPFLDCNKTQKLSDTLKVSDSLPASVCQYP